MTGTPLSASVIVCAFADDRLELTVRCVEAALQQEPAPAQMIVVVDHNPGLEAQLRERLPAATVVPNAGDRGLSSARNAGIALASADVVAFLDDDACPHPGWLAALLDGFSDSSIAGVGGRANANWETGQPDWFPDPFLWVVGCSYGGQPDAGEVRNPIGCNMAFRREVFDQAGLFDVNIGRLGSHPLGCEETEICIRAAREIPGARFALVRGAEIDHWVPASRAEPRYLLRRCFYEGVSKALVRTLGDERSLDTERSYVTRTLSAEIFRSLISAVTGPDREAGLGRIAAVIGGLGAATAGYLYGSVLFRNRQAPGDVVKQ
ncbi:MAG: glycosyltransferase family 2 protein [Solirubrobacterales bacterium]|nr:glycosyltransferase family 2 protein [Solirubrobacterales bacterium]